MRLIDWHRLYLTVVALLVLAYIFKPCKTDCPDVEPPNTSRTITVVPHDTAGVRRTVPLDRKQEIRIKRKFLQMPDTLRYAVDSTIADTCTVYTASSGDSLVDIEVSVCSPCELDSIGIGLRHKGVKTLIIQDSIRVPVAVGSTKMLFAGMMVSSGGGFGPKISYTNPRNQFMYYFDAVNRHHYVGVAWSLWRR